MQKDLATRHQELYVLKKASFPKTYNNTKKFSFKIKEEKLDITKELVETGEVKAYKEIYVKNKTFTIPIKYEELVIENTPSVSKDYQSDTKSANIIRIPLSEEQVEFKKHTVILEDVSIYSEKIDCIEHIEEILKKEKYKLKTNGSPKIINKLN